ncbi:ATP-NAD kinase family protein [Aliikangiella coralliicola]|uniref:ATP-NAD kinase n=1 Tax=Aliikangiella coralliicola TaxID=2592383 RepID=A0A545UAN0_9GAMM|nr:ATP-NAD kinase family protein [Aliikangiella coralliicola]TQV86525.1 ATP-NAD kinase [Aliikangiella coralliicola]
MFKLGLIVNPFAGIGGRIGLKGSDGQTIREKAMQMGAIKLAQSKASIALEVLLPLADSFEVFTVSGDMGEDLCRRLGFSYHTLVQAEQPSTEKDTCNAVKVIQQQGVDLLLFAGGDGTARNIYQVCDEEQLVLGIPAGVKIHSGVYAITPQAAGLLVKEMIEGKILSLLSADVMDIDENAFREGVVKARQYGNLNVPGALAYVQAVKSGGRELEELVLDDIAAEVIESMEDDTYYVIGSGTTCAVVMEQLNLNNTLLGSDIVFQGELYREDAIEKDFLELLAQGKQLKFIITVIGGQGHILGRGNHQYSPEVIRQAGWKNFEVIATKSKLNQLDGRPLLTDTGDAALDNELVGRKRVITGYRDFVVYPVGISQ